MTRNPSSTRRVSWSVAALVPVPVALALAAASPGSPSVAPQSPGSPSVTPQSPGSPSVTPQSPGSSLVASASPGSPLAPPTTSGGQPAASGGSVADTVSFADDVLPIFQARCAKCHGAAGDDGEPRTEMGLNLLEYDRVMLGSEFGPVVEAGSAENSYLLEMIVEGDMPEEGDPVPEEEIAIVRAWIEAGAPNN